MFSKGRLARFGFGAKLTAPKKLAVAIRARKQVWHCATPKSASTFLTLILRKLWERDCCHGAPVPYWGDRVQEPDAFTVFQRISTSKKPYYSGHLHQRCNLYMQQTFLEGAAQNGGGAIVQSRDVGDTIISLKEHFDRESKPTGGNLGPWFTSLGDLWPTLSEDEKFLLVADIYAYWHFDFIRSWQRYPQRIDVLYEDLVASPVAVLVEICRYYGFQKSEAEIESAVALVDGYSSEKRRFNVGKTGRGKTMLPTSVQARIEELDALCLKAAPPV